MKKQKQHYLEFGFLSFELEIQADHKNDLKWDQQWVVIDPVEIKGEGLVLKFFKLLSIYWLECHCVVNKIADKCRD